MPLNTFGEWEDAGDTPANLDDMSTEQLRALSYREAAEAHVAMREQAQSPVEDPTEKMSLEEIRAKIREEEQVEKQKLVEAGVQDACNTFIDNFPQYIPCPENLSAMQDYLTGAGVETPTVEDLEQAYSTLKKKGRLRIDERADFTQKQLGRYARHIAQAHAEMEAKREFEKANDPESMSLEDLRILINRQEREKNKVVV
jgi:hypothetical protein